MKAILRLVAPRLVRAAIFLRQALLRLLGRAEVPPGLFVSDEFSQCGLTRKYKLYMPPPRGDQPLPLIVMLHGCGQHPDDFAAGTGMNEHAQREGFYVLYPEQSKDANALRCWNWFKHNHQQRDRGEPAWIAALTSKIIGTHAIDPARVYIAGLSAGGAMAAIVAAEYPEIYAAVGVHSGLAPGAAASALEAMGAMKGLGKSTAAMNWFAKPGKPLSVPTIVFHGDQDKTVHPVNADRVMSARLAGQPDGLEPRQELGRNGRGRRFTRSIYRDGQGLLLGEHWLVHGAGHAWSGGHPKASYTDALGPDASRQMLRFFFMGRA